MTWPWPPARVRELAILLNGHPFDSAHFADVGDMPLVRIRDLLSEPFETFVPADAVPESAVVQDGDVVIGMDGEFNCVLWKRGRAALNQRLCLLRSAGQNDARYLAYALPDHLRVINDLTYATTVKHLSSSQVRAIRLPAPPPSVQRAIADYLDRETARIDALIGEQDRLVGVLHERRRAVVERLVSSGLVAHSPVKPSRLRWAGDVPRHWRVGNIRRFSAMKTGHTPSRSVGSYWVDCDIPWVTLADVGQMRADRELYVSPETTSCINALGLANSAAELLPAGTVMLSRTASVGFSAIMPTAMATSQDYWNWVCRPDLLPEYLVLVFRAMRREFRALMIGSTHKTIYQTTAASLVIPVPPLVEQQDIIDRVAEESAKIDALITKAEQFISLARERRSALITAAVTGQIDVRAAS